MVWRCKGWVGWSELCCLFFWWVMAGLPAMAPPKGRQTTTTTHNSNSTKKKKESEWVKQRQAAVNLKSWWSVSCWNEMNGAPSGFIRAASQGSQQHQFHQFPRSSKRGIDWSWVGSCGVNFSSSSIEEWDWVGYGRRPSTAHHSIPESKNFPSFQLLALLLWFIKEKTSELEWMSWLKKSLLFLAEQDGWWMKWNNSTWMAVNQFIWLMEWIELVSLNGGAPRPSGSGMKRIERIEMSWMKRN